MIYKDVIYDYEPIIDVVKTKKKIIQQSRNKKWEK